MAEERVPIPGSAPVHASEAHFTAAPADTVLDVTIMLRRPSPGAMAADPQDLTAVRNFVQSYGLRVISENPDARTMKVEGTVSQFQAAFGVTLQQTGGAGGHQFLTYQGPLSIPKQLKGIIVAVLGLDRRPAAKPRVNNSSAETLDKST